MSEALAARDAAWRDALRAAAALALAPRLLGGAHVRAAPGPVREAWLHVLKSLLPESAPWRRVPAHVSESRLIGGLDLAATLRAGRPVAERGLLAECSGGIAVLLMAERAAPATLAQLRAALDHGEIRVAREGISASVDTGLAVLALDESLDDEDGLSASLADRLALHVDLRRLGIAGLCEAPWRREHLELARERLPGVALPDEALEAMAAAAQALGVESMRALLLATSLARVSAALDAREAPEAADLQFAARMALAPHATRMPDAASPPPDAPPPTDVEGQGEDSRDTPERGPLEERVLEAVAAALPADLLARLGRETPRRGSIRSAGSAGALRRSQHRGRPAGVLPGDPRRGARLALVATLRAAAPWQPLRRREQRTGDDGARVRVRREDFRVTRFRQPAETTTIFVVDASGSSALHRLAEAKGAVELLLADCYVRRDQVAVLAFRGKGAELLLPPTRSLLRAKRSLAGLPGGGGTPLASALDLTALLCEQVRRRGATPGVVLMTDGRANVRRDGSAGREQAIAESLDAARVLRASGVRAILVDTSPRPHTTAEQLALALGAAYVPLPHADPKRLREAVLADRGASRRGAAAAP